MFLMMMTTVFLGSLSLLSSTYPMLLILMEYISVVVIFYYMSSSLVTLSPMLFTISFVMIFEGVLFSCLVMTNNK
uniref:NADH dehydrogenase subunit 4L n=1 Tax=Salpa thompsoni TaxID=569448 RepID=A0A2Z5U2V4_9UROC|nr:NADH dehydrogenase subunit 4L [Salpa thompsoni]